MARSRSRSRFFFEAGADAGTEEDGIKRLGHVILGAQFEAAGDAFLLIQGRDHDDRDLGEGGGGLEFGQHLVAVQAGHHHVQEDEVEAAGAGRLQRLQSAGRDRDRPAVVREAAREHVAIGVVVIHHEQMAAELGRRVRAERPRRGEPESRWQQVRRPGPGLQRSGGRRDEILFHQRQPGPRGAGDLLEVRQQLRAAEGLGFFFEQLTVADDVVDRRAQFVAKLVEIVPLGLENLLVEILGDQRQQLPSAGVNLPQIGLERRRRVLILLQHLAVAQDVIDGGAQVMAQPGKVQPRAARGRARRGLRTGRSGGVTHGHWKGESRKQKAERRKAKATPLSFLLSTFCFLLSTCCSWLVFG